MNTENLSSDLLNLFIGEFPNNETNLPLHIFECLKNTSGVIDEASKQKLKVALANFSLENVFDEEKYVLNGSKYTVLDALDINKKQNYSIFTKHKIDTFSFLNYLSSNFYEIDLNSTHEEIELISEALLGVYERTQYYRELGEINLEEQLGDINIELHRLGKYLHWQICDEFSLRGRADFSDLTPMITSAVLIKTYVLTDISQCNGKCGKIYTTLEENTGVTCECGGEILLAPPMLKVENISFVIPNEIENIVTDSEESSPKSLINLINKTFPNRKLLLLLNQLGEYRMREKIIIPSDAIFNYKDTNDIIQVNFIYEIKDKKEIYIFACITDTRYTDSCFISSVSLPVIMRDIQNGLKGEFNWEQVISKSELRDWKVTKFIKGKELEKISSFKEIDELYQGDVKDV